MSARMRSKTRVVNEERSKERENDGEEREITR